MPYDQSDPAHCLNPDVTGDVRESVEIGASTLVYGFMHRMIAFYVSPPCALRPGSPRPFELLSILQRRVYNRRVHAAASTLAWFTIT